MTEEVKYAVVKKDKEILAYYRGTHVGTVVEGDEASVVALMETLGEKVAERIRATFMAEVPAMAQELEAYVQRHLFVSAMTRRLMPKPSFFERLFG